MRSDKYSGMGRDWRNDTLPGDRWEETNQIFQDRDRERSRQKEQQQKRQLQDDAYQEYLAMREQPDANYSPDGSVKPAAKKKSKNAGPVFSNDEEEQKLTRKERKALDKQEKKAVKKKKKGRWVLRIILILILLLVIAGAAGVLFVMGMMDKVGSLDINQSNLGISPQVERDLQNYQNIALLGVDARDMEDYKSSRTDAIIILSIDKTKEKIRQISVYRDTYLHVNEKYGYDKITNVHAYAGTTATLHSLNENMDLNIKEAVVVNWKAVADAIDGLGGIEVDIQKSEIKEMNKYIKDTQKNIGGSKKKIKKPGKQTLNGNQAVTYARIRKDSAEGDYRRNERMKIVVSAAVDKAKKTNPMQLNKIAEQVLPQIKTNMETNNMLKVMVDFFRYDMSGSTGWPFDTAGWTNYNGAWCGPPVTLESNVKKLHKKYFGQKSYDPTKTVQEISAEISRRTGYY